MLQLPSGINTINIVFIQQILVNLKLSTFQSSQFNKFFKYFRVDQSFTNYYFYHQINQLNSPQNLSTTFWINRRFNIQYIIQYPNENDIPLIEGTINNLYHQQFGNDFLVNQNQEYQYVLIHDYSILRLLFKNIFNNISICTCKKIMSIIYALICKNAQNDQIYTLCEYDTASGNYPQVVTNMLKKMTQKQTKITFSYNSQYYFHILKDGVLSFVCMTDITYNIQQAFMFLEQLKINLKKNIQNEQIVVAKAYGLSAQFSNVMKQLVIQFNEIKKVDTKISLNQKLNDVKDILTENIDKILSRQEKVQLFVKRATKTDKFAENMKKAATQVNQQMFWRNNRCKIFIGVTIVIAIIAAIYIL